jgi:hypothetical protein
MVVSFLVQPGPLQLFPDVGNPLPLGPDLRPVLGYQASQLTAQGAALFAPLIAWAMVVRYRRSDAVGRGQLKWFVFSMTASVLAISAAAAASTVTDRVPEAALALFGFGGAFVAVAIGIAILRHGLYDIDRIISRTLGYGVLTAIIACVFGAIVVGLSAVVGSVLADEASEAIAVAGATLVVAVSAGPLRRRLQASIDRRFDRSAFDATVTLGLLTARLRDDVAIEKVQADVLGAIDRTFHPSTIAVWLRPRPGRRADLVTIPGRAGDTVQET